MPWGPQKRAGFALAALLSGDRELRAVEAALAPELCAALRGALEDASARKAAAIAEWLGQLRPELDQAALALPARARALLAPLAKPALRRALLAGAPPSRPHYAAEPALLAALARGARRSGGPR